MTLGLWAPLAAPNADAAGTPAIFHVSPSADPSTDGFRVIGIRGDGFGPKPGVLISCPAGGCSSYTITSACASPTAVNCIASASDRFVSVALPSDSELGTKPFDVRVSSGGALSGTATVNAPQIQQLEFDQIYPGESFRIFGTNLGLRGSNPTVTFVPSTGQAPTVISATSTVLTVQAPSNVKEGVSYQVQVSNGAGSAGTVTSTDHLQGRAALSTAQDYGLDVPWQVDLPAQSGRFVVNAASPPSAFFKAYPSFCTSYPSTLDAQGNKVPGAPHCVNFCPASENPGNGSCLSGVKGDGLTDDQPILQALLFYVASQTDSQGNAVGGVLNLPYGRIALVSNNSLQSGCTLQSTGAPVPCSTTGPMLQIANSSVLTIPPNVVLSGPATLYYGFGPAPVPTPTAKANYAFHAIGLVFNGVSTPSGDNRALNSGIQNLEIVNLDQFAGLKTPAEIDLPHWDGVTGAAPGVCTSDLAVSLRTNVPSGNIWGSGPISVNAMNPALRINEPKPSPVSQIFISNIYFDETRSSGGVNLIAGGQGTIGGLLSHVVLQGSRIMRSSCYASWAPLFVSGDYFNVRGNWVRNYYSRNTEISGDHLVLEGNTFERRRDRISAPFNGGEFEGANNGGPEFVGANLVFLGNQSIVKGIPPEGDWLAYETSYATDPLRFGSVLSTHDQYGENFSSQWCGSANQDMGYVDPSSTSDTLVSNSFKGSPWWVADSLVNGQPVDWTTIPEISPEEAAISANWASVAPYGGGDISRYVAIIDGPGAGQLRRIVRYQDSKTLKIDRAWDELPVDPLHKTKSVYAVLAGNLSNVIFERNLTQGSPVAYVFYCGGVNVQVANNQVQDDGAVWLRSVQDAWTYPTPPKSGALPPAQFLGRNDMLWDFTVTGNQVADSPSPPFDPAYLAWSSAAGWHPYFPSSIYADGLINYDTSYPNNYAGGILNAGIEIRGNSVSLLPSVTMTPPEGTLAARGIAATATWGLSKPGLIPSQTPLALGTILDSNRVGYISPDENTLLKVDLNYQCVVTSAAGDTTTSPLSTKNATCVAPKGGSAKIEVIPQGSVNDFAYSTYGTQNATIWNPLGSSSVNGACALKSAYYFSWIVNPALQQARITATLPLLPPGGWTDSPTVAPYYQCTEFGSY